MFMLLPTHSRQLGKKQRDAPHLLTSPHETGTPDVPPPPTTARPVHMCIRERERLQEEAEALAASATKEERENGLEREREARAAGRADAAAATAVLREKDRVDAEGRQSAALAEAALRAEVMAAEVRSVEREARRRADVDAQAARAELEKELAKARERAVKLESGKWQRASREAEARAAAEKVLPSSHASDVIIVPSSYHHRTIITY